MPRHKAKVLRDISNAESALKAARERGNARHIRQHLGSLAALHSEIEGHTDAADAHKQIAETHLDEASKVNKRQTLRLQRQREVYLADKYGNAADALGKAADACEKAGNTSQAAEYRAQSGEYRELHDKLMSGEAQ